MIGFAGVIALLGPDFRGHAGELLGAAAVLLSALGCKAAALVSPAMAGSCSRHWSSDGELMTLLSSAAFAAPVAADLPRQIPPASSILALIALGLVNTGLAYWLFYALIDDAGAATASLITYVMPVVALALGVGLLAEPLTAAAVTGLVLIALGTWLAASRPAGRDRPDTNRQ